MILLILLVVAAAGCTVKVGPEGENAETGEIEDVETEEAEEETETDTDTVDCVQYYKEYKEHLASGFSETAAVALTNECVKTHSPTADELAAIAASSSSSSPSSASSPSSTTTTTPAAIAQAGDVQDVKSYMEENPQAQFPDLIERLQDVTTTSDTIALSFSTGLADPGSEAVYLSGVLLVVYPATEKVNVTGYNDEDKEMEAGTKRFTRKKYNFNNYKTWFPDYEYNECTEDEECADTNECTRDFCKDKRCYNSRLVTSSCPA